MFRGVGIAEDHQGQRDDAHGLLGVIEAVARRHEAGGQQLQLAEGPVDLAALYGGAYPVDDPHEQKAHGIARQGRDDQRQQHLADDAAQVEPGHAAVGHGRPDEAADEGMRGRRGDTEIPGDAVPADGPDQRGQHQHMTALHHFGQHDAAAQRLGDLRPQQGADEVERRRAAHGKPGGDHLGGNDRGDGIGAVVRAVGKVEHQGDQHDERKKKGDLKHFSIPLLPGFRQGC